MIRAFAEATADYPRLIDTVARSLAEVLRDCCVVFVLSGDGTCLSPASIHAPHAGALLRPIHALREAKPLGLRDHPVAHRVLETGEALLVPHLHRGQSPWQTPDEYVAFNERLGVHSLLVVALRVRGQPIGMLSVARFRPDSPPFGEPDRDLAQSLADHAALAICNARSLAAERAAREEAERASRALRASEERHRRTYEEHLRARDARGRAEGRFARASQPEFRELLEAAPDAMVITDSEGRIVLVNGQMEKLFGFAREEILERNVEMLVPARFRDDHASQRADYFRDPSARPMGSVQALHGLRKDGTEFPIEISLSPMRTEQGVLVSSAIRDISERRRAEERLRRSEEQFRRLVGSVKDYAILMLDAEGRVASWNPGAERIKGFSAEEIVGQHFSRFYPPEDIVSGKPEMELRVAKAEGRFEEEGYRVRKDGSRFWAHLVLTAILDKNGDLVGFSKVTRDITERKVAEKALKMAIGELEAFSYSVAHDLRAPLRAVNGFSQILLDDHADKLDEDGRDCLREICASAQKMAELIDALLSLSRVTRSELRLERTDLSAMARTAASQLAAGDPERGVDVVVEENLEADADPRLLRVLLDNLLGNAWKFTSGRAAPRIELGAIDMDGARVFVVRDNGAGFDMAFAKKLFTPFQRLHTSAQFPGMGIGLATVQRIVRRHGGRIWAEGMVGGGAAFYFTLSSHPIAGPSSRSPSAM